MDGPGDANGTQALRHRMRLAAEAVLDFAEPTYGPRGLAKAIAQNDGSLRVLGSGASALREVGVADPDIQPYVELAAAVQEHAGDQATAGLLLAAHLVRNALKGIESGIPAAAFLDGYALATKQARGALHAMAKADPKGASLDAVVAQRRGLAGLVVEGLRRFGRGRDAVPLDAIDIRTDDRDADAAAWLDGLALAPQHVARRMQDHDVKVLLLTDDWKPGPWKEDLAYKMTASVELGAWTANEDRLRRRARDHLVGLGVGLVVCHREVEAGLAELCTDAGIAVWNDAPDSSTQRVERATGAKPVARLMHAAATDLGAGHLSKRARHVSGWLLSGKGPAATLSVPAHNALSQAQARDDAERILRAAGAWLREPEAVPGGGRWQRHVARSIRKASDAGPGKTPLALRAAADAFDALADSLVRNLGGDPMDTPVPTDAAEVTDPALPVRIAAVGALEMAIQVLRIDARYAKQPTSTAGLRGGEGKPMNVREMAGDVPPLM